MTTYLLVIPPLVSPPLGEPGTPILEGILLHVFLPTAVIVTALALHTGDHVGAGKIHLQPLANSSFYLALGAPRTARRLLAQPVLVSEFVSVHPVLMNFNEREEEEGFKVGGQPISIKRTSRGGEDSSYMNINIRLATRFIRSAFFFLVEIYLFLSIFFFSCEIVRERGEFLIFDFSFYGKCVTIYIGESRSIRFYLSICERKYLYFTRLSCFCNNRLNELYFYLN